MELTGKLIVSAIIYLEFCSVSMEFPRNVLLNTSVAFSARLMT